jgi:hypothetical protein
MNTEAIRIESFKASPFTETIISYKTAQIARDKGFPLELSGYEWEPDTAGIPTQSLLQAWLRTVHNINIVAVQVPDSNNHSIYLNGREWWVNGYRRICEAGYEPCLERGLQEALQLIKT